MNAQMLFVGGDFVLWWVCYVGLYFPPLFSLKVWVDPPYIGDWTLLPAIITKRERERGVTPPLPFYLASGQLG
jgi:hypothetical protein